MNNDQIYSIPGRFRRIENLHILLWLLKDVCWALNFRVAGMIMVIPTLTVAVVITWQTRKLVAELVHNLAVVCWITANCLWMTGEFYGWDEGEWGARRLALFPFITGLLVLGYFYLVLVPSKRFRDRMKARKEAILEQEQKTGSHN